MSLCLLVWRIYHDNTPTKCSQTMGGFKEIPQLHCSESRKAYINLVHHLVKKLWSRFEVDKLKCEDKIAFGMM